VSGRQRRDTLRALVAWSGELTQLTAGLAHGAILPESDAVVIRRQDVMNAIERFESGDATALELEEWAETVHTNEDIELDENDRSLVAQALFELSTPELFGDPADVARSLRRRLAAE